MLKKILIKSLIFVVVVVNVFALPMSTSAYTDDWDAREAARILGKTNIFDLKSKSAMLIEAVTPRILLKKNVNEKLPIASITKIMSMLLIMEAIDSGKITLNDEVKVSEHAWSMGGSQVYLEPGEVFSVEEMLKAVAIHSANDATVALAEKIWGGEDIFVQKMNEKAEELGMKDTKFLDCTGLTDEGHYSTAHDVALMARELVLKHPKILEYTSIWHDTFRDGEFSLDNTNKLIRFYEGAKGLKTGFTSKAGHCLAANAEKNGLHMISIILGGPDTNTRFAEARKLLEYGFTNFKIENVNKKGDPAGEIEVKKGLQTKVKLLVSKDVNLLINIADKSKLECKTNIKKSITAPVKAGQKVGEVLYVIEDKEVEKVDIVTASDVDKASFFRLFFRMITDWLNIG